ncbi:inverse autotransporter beta domain-containing protein [Escherichia coli]|nr:inverse autotransporter beta domain-containing protein [Escherichia coli]
MKWRCLVNTSDKNDPHAITAGLSCTPVPLISFSAEQRRANRRKRHRIGMG